MNTAGPNQRRDETPNERTGLLIQFEDGIGVENVVELLEKLGDLYRKVAGDQLVITETQGVPCHIEIGGGAPPPDIYALLNLPKRPRS